jgi:hypothetical protein
MVLAVSGCGGDKTTSGTVPEGAEFAPASSVVYISGVTDPESSQWEKADKLLGRFPGREKLLASARKDLKKDGLTWESDVKPALGTEISLVLLDFKDADHNYVFFTKPKDEAKFDKLLESGDDPQVHRKIDGWTVFADNQQSLGNFERARSSGDPLSGNKEFKEAMEDLPEDAALRGFVSGQAIYDLIQEEAGSDADARDFQRFTQTFGKLESISFSALAEDEGVSVEAAFTSKGQGKLGSFSPELVDDLPADALLFVSFGDLEDFLNSVVKSLDDSVPEFKTQRSQIESALGFSLKEDLFPLFSKEGAIAVYRGGELVPDVLFVLRVPDEDKARKIVDRVAALASLGGETARPFRVDGAEGKQIVIAEGGFSIFAVVTDGKAFVSNSRPTIQQSLGDGKKLADDEVYKEAREASGAPGETTSLVYLNLKTGLPYVFDFVELDDPSAITPEVRANTEPLRSAVFYAKQDGDRTSISGFLTIK